MVPPRQSRHRPPSALQNRHALLPLEPLRIPSETSLSLQAALVFAALTYAGQLPVAELAAFAASWEVLQRRAAGSTLQPGEAEDLAHLQQFMECMLFHRADKLASGMQIGCCAWMIHRCLSSRSDAAATAGSTDLARRQQAQGWQNYRLAPSWASHKVRQLVTQVGLQSRPQRSKAVSAERNTHTVCCALQAAAEVRRGLDGTSAEQAPDEARPLVAASQSREATLTQQQCCRPWQL